VQHDDVPQPADYSEILAANVRAARARADETQSAVAKRMRLLGARWHFQTVGAVERGERPLSAFEVGALALVLQTTPDVLYLPPQNAAQVAFGDQVVPAQRLSIVDDSVSWDGDDLKITPPTEHYRPADLRAALLAVRDQMREPEPGER
jgi:hypothetical protein